MHDSATCCHELQISAPDRSLVAGEILVIDRAIDEVRDRFLTTVRVIWKPGTWSDGKMVKPRDSQPHASNASGTMTTYIKNGVKFRSFAVPIDRRTVAPAPSDCSRASNTLLMARGTGLAALRQGSSGGMTGRPTKVLDGAIAENVRLLVVTLARKVFNIGFALAFLKIERMYSVRTSCG